MNPNQVPILTTTDWRGTRIVRGDHVVFSQLGWISEPTEAMITDIILVPAHTPWQGWWRSEDMVLLEVRWVAGKKLDTISGYYEIPAEYATKLGE